MSYRFATLQSILRVLADSQWHKPSYIATHAGITRPTANKYLAKLLGDKKIKKQGSGPHVQYRIADVSYIPQNTPVQTSISHTFDYQQSTLLDENFLKYDADGSVLDGVQGFILWCERRGLDPYVKYDDYKQLCDTIQSLYNSCGLLDATRSFTQHVDTQALDVIYYADQYKYKEFGRGKLAEMAFFAKQLQHKELIDIVMKSIVRKVECLIKTTNIDALAFTPPSIVDRRYQILDVFDTYLSHISLPRVNLIKDYPGIIRTPQKSLKSRADRIRNAQNSIYVYDETTKNYKTVLLIDDFVGSGATLNETAKKLKDEGVEKVIGFAIVGNMDLRYEVINEM